MTPITLLAIINLVMSVVLTVISINRLRHEENKYLINIINIVPMLGMSSSVLQAFFAVTPSFCPPVLYFGLQTLWMLLLITIIRLIGIVK